MVTEAQLIQALEGTIKAQDQLINYLKAEVARLSVVQYPIVQPYTQPSNPLTPTWIITSTGPLTTGNPGSPNPENNPPNSGWTTTISSNVEGLTTTANTQSDPLSGAKVTLGPTHGTITFGSAKIDGKVVGSN